MKRNPREIALELAAELRTDGIHPRELAAELRPDELAEVLEHLDAHAVPAPTPEATAALIAHLRLLLPQPRSRRFRAEGLSQEPLANLLLSLGAQLRLFHPLWWLISLGVVVLGAVLSEPLALEGLSVTALAPLLVVGGVAYSFRSLKGGALELELSSPVSPTQVVLGRILVMTGYYLLLGALLALSAGSFGLALLSWVAALFLFTGLTLALTLYLGTGASVALALTIWGLQFILLKPGWSLFALPETARWLPLQVGALAAGGALLVLALTSGHLYRLLERGDG